MTADNEIEVAETETRYLHRVFATNKLYGTGKHRFETVILQAEKKSINGERFHKISFEKALGFVVQRGGKHRRRSAERPDSIFW